ncbi:uncharacterized protein ISCGN_009869 [Ixodes scapularis]
MATQGKLQQFDGTAWPSWAERLGFYCEANGVLEPTKKRALLLTLCGAKTYEVVRALVAPKTPGEVSFDELMATLKKHYDPRPSELFSRTRFQRRDQQAGESISSYVAALKKLSADCNFGVLTATPAAVTASTRNAGSAGESRSPARQPELNPTLLPLEVMFRDRFVCGLRDEHLQQRLFAEVNLTFQKEHDMALRSEIAAQHQKDLKAEKSEIHKIRKEKTTLKKRDIKERRTS